MVIAKEWFMVEEAAEHLHVSKRTIYKLTKEGRLPVFRIRKERHRRFYKEDLDRVPRPGEETTNLEALLRRFETLIRCLPKSGIMKRMQPMTEYSRGYVVLDSFIFSDESEERRRPAVIAGSN